MAANTHWVVLCFISQIIVLFLIYVIWTQSTSNMRHLKKYLLEMAIVDMLCSLNMGLFVQPNFLYPLPILVFNGLYKFLDADAHVIIISITLTLVASAFLLVVLCSILRFFLIHNYQSMVSFMTRKTGIILHLVIVGATFGLCVYFLTDVILNFRKTFMAAQSHNLEMYLIPYIGEAEAVMGVRPTDEVIVLFYVALGIFIFGILLTMILSYFCYKKTSIRMAHASSETKSLNRGLTWLLILQCIVPALTLVIPGFLMILPFYVTISVEFEAFMAEYLLSTGPTGSMSNFIPMLVIFLLLPIGYYAMSLTQAEMMATIFENGDRARNSPEWTKELGSRLLPIGYVAGQPIRSRFWERVNPNERILFDQDGIPFQQPWRFNNKPLTLGGRYKLMAKKNRAN